ncbi:PepSY domain-containing protein [uncultured Caulobacter sp.]|uniref:PepSY domain-containing protein n=1 Tax=uncultured Caulobacter sp. TaxID=158749 RepID=UPI002614FF67|nr:PepSY domain-containing protein [uncultured Caulobacter sp.]
MGKVLRWLSWFHRWTGVGLCLLFLLWFASGAILLFVPFPSLGDKDRLAGSERFDPAAIAIAPGQALATAGGGEGLRLVSVAGAPRYVIQGVDGALKTIDARGGRIAPELTADQARTIAQRFAGVGVKRVSAPIRYDQWVVHNRFDPWRPFFKVSLADRAGTELYVSAKTGEVMQRTRRAERAWNWGGAVIHWLYFTALRRSFAAWDQTVWWVSLLGVTTAAIGIFLGIYRTQKRMQGRKPDWSPFRGWLRWHHGLGLGAAVFVLTWIVSGWLSMDHGRLFSRGVAAEEAASRYHGQALDQALAGAPASRLAALGPTSSIVFGVVGGHPVAAAEDGRTSRVRLLDGDAASVTPTLPRDLLLSAARSAWPISTAPAAKDDDALYRTAEGMAPRTIRLPLDRPTGSAVYLDPVTGHVVSVMDPSRKAYAWIYYALHTFNFPVLIDRPVLRKVIVLIPLLLGLMFSWTSLVVAIKRVRLSAA